MKIFIQLFFLILILSCNKSGQINSENLGNGYSVNATIRLLPDSLKVYLVDLNNNIDGKVVFIDSTYTKNGAFKFRGKVDNPLEVGIGFSNPKKNQYLTEHKKFWLENSNIQIIGSFNDFENSDIVGSYINDLIKRAKYEAKVEMIDEAEIYYMENELKSISNKGEINEIRKKYHNLSRKQLWNFIFDNPNHEQSVLDILSHKKGGMALDSFSLFYERLSPQFKKTVNGQKVKKYANYKKLIDGDFFVDFQAKDLDGNNIKLSDFKGKVILLDFGASWCAPCREFSIDVAPKLIKKYDKYEFVLINYSLDTDKKRWKKMIIEDNMNWVSLSNLEGVNDDAALKYDIQEIPDFILIDKMGKILKSNPGKINVDLLEKRIDSLVKING